MTEPDRHLFLVYSNAAPGRRDEFDQWYDNHLMEVLAVGPCVEARRYWLSPARGASVLIPSWEHMVVYELEGEDAVAAMAEITGAVAAGRISAPREGMMLDFASAVYSPHDGAAASAPVAG